LETTTSPARSPSRPSIPRAVSRSAPPHVAPVDHPDEEHLVAEAVGVARERQVLLAPAQVEAYALDGEVGEDRHRRAHVTEIRRDHDRRPIPKIAPGRS
jgi:hypothetical protein